jgi:hypothetical protein
MSRTFHHHHRRMRWGGPNWWNRLYGTRVQRAKAKLILRMAVRLVDIETMKELPDPRKNDRGFF